MLHFQIFGYGEEDTASTRMVVERILKQAEEAGDEERVELGFHIALSEHSSRMANLMGDHRGLILVSAVGGKTAEALYRYKKRIEAAIDKYGGGELRNTPLVFSEWAATAGS